MVDENQDGTMTGWRRDHRRQHASPNNEQPNPLAEEREEEQAPQKEQRSDEHS